MTKQVVVTRQHSGKLTSSKRFWLAAGHCSHLSQHIRCATTHDCKTTVEGRGEVRQHIAEPVGQRRSCQHIGNGYRYRLDKDRLSGHFAWRLSQPQFRFTLSDLHKCCSLLLSPQPRLFRLHAGRLDHLVCKGSLEYLNILFRVLYMGVQIERRYYSLGYISDTTLFHFRFPVRETSLKTAQSYLTFS